MNYRFSNGNPRCTLSSHKMHTELTLAGLGLNRESYRHTGNHFVVFSLLKRTSGTNRACELLSIISVNWSQSFHHWEKESLILQKAGSHEIKIGLTNSQDGFTPHLQADGRTQDSFKQITGFETFPPTSG